MAKHKAKKGSKRRQQQEGRENKRYIPMKDFEVVTK